MSYDFTKLKNALEEKEYLVSVFDTKEEAAECIDGEINGKTVGFGGSVTLHEMNLYKMLSTHNTVYWHDEKPDHMTIMETRTAATKADIYISSVNGISENGIASAKGTKWFFPYAP